MGRPRKLTAEQENEVWNRFTSGEKVTSIAKAMGLKYNTVYLSIRRETNGPTSSYTPAADGNGTNEESANA